MKRMFAIGLILIVLLGFAALPISANETVNSSEPFNTLQLVEPLLDNGDYCVLTFGITSSGLAGIDIDYVGIQGVTTKVTARVYLQKKMIGIVWARVAIGTTDNEWVASSTDYRGDFYFSHQLTSTGTYRAVIEVTMSGTGGEDDVILQKLQKTY